MTGISTKDIQTGGGALPKTLQPGNRVIKIDKIYLEEFPFKEGGYHIVMNTQGADLGADFEGFFIDKDNESLGRHKGQVGRVKASEWAFADAELEKSGTKIVRDDEILKFLKNLCEATGCEEWLIGVDNKFNTIEELIGAFNDEKPFADKFLNVCLSGREYMNKQNYIQHDLYFPKFTRNGIPFESESVDSAASRVYAFDPENHIKKLKKAKEVENFEGGADGADGAEGDGAKKDFDI